MVVGIKKLKVAKIERLEILNPVVSGLQVRQLRLHGETTGFRSHRDDYLETPADLLKLQSSYSATILTRPLLVRIPCKVEKK